MKKIKKLLYCYIAVLFFAFFAFLFASFAFAQYGAPYGGGAPAVSQIVVDKFIKDPSQKGEVFVDNLTLPDYHFSPGEEIVFKVRVKNTGQTTFAKVDVVDFIPALTLYVLESGDTRESIREISKTFENLKPDEAQEFLLQVKVKNADKIPEGVSCAHPNAVNRVVARAEGQQETSDTSSFCVEKKVLGAVEQPAAGAELWIVALGFLGVWGGLGIMRLIRPMRLIRHIDKS